MLLLLVCAMNEFPDRRFGLANPEALAAGQTGTACRGEEHDVTLVWSLTSGKRLILADGKEVHYSNNRGNLFDYSWTMRGGNVLKVVAHASPPMSPTPGFRQYDFFVNGQSFFTFPKVFRLGLSPSDPRQIAISPTNSTSLAESSRRHLTSGGSYRSGSGRLAASGGGAGAGSSGNIASLEEPENPDEVSTSRRALRLDVCVCMYVCVCGKVVVARFPIIILILTLLVLLESYRYYSLRRKKLTCKRPFDSRSEAM